MAPRFPRGPHQGPFTGHTGVHWSRIFYQHSFAQPSFLKHNSCARMAPEVPHGGPLGELCQGPQVYLQVR